MPGWECEAPEEQRSDWECRSAVSAPAKRGTGSRDGGCRYRRTQARPVFVGSGKKMSGGGEPFWPPRALTGVVHLPPQLARWLPRALRAWSRGVPAAALAPGGRPSGGTGAQAGQPGWRGGQRWAGPGRAGPGWVGGGRGSGAVSAARLRPAPRVARRGRWRRPGPARAAARGAGPGRVDRAERSRAAWGRAGRHRGAGQRHAGIARRRASPGLLREAWAAARMPRDANMERRSGSSRPPPAPLLRFPLAFHRSRLPFAPSLVLLSPFPLPLSLLPPYPLHPRSCLPSPASTLSSSFLFFLFILYFYPSVSHSLSVHPSSPINSPPSPMPPAARSTAQGPPGPEEGSLLASPALTRLGRGASLRSRWHLRLGAV